MMKQYALSIVLSLVILSIGSPILAQENTEGADTGAETSDAELQERLDELERKLADLEEAVEEVQSIPHIEEPTISGESRIAWEYGIETGGTGFLNENDIVINVPLIRGTESNRYGTGGLRMQMSIYKFNISAGVDPQSTAMNFNEGKIEAKIMWNNYYLITSLNPDYLLDYAIPVGDPNLNVRTNTVYSTGGILFGIEGRGNRYELKLGSIGVGLNNPYNKYSYGLDFAQRLIPNRLNLKGKMYNKFKSLNYHKLAIKHYFFLVLAKSVKVKMEKSVRNKNQLK